MIKKGLVTTLAAILICGASLAYASSIEMGVGVWNQRPSGDMASGAETLDVRNNLGYGSETRIFDRAKIETPSFLPNVYLMTTPMSFNGNGSKDVAFTFHNINFSANTPISSKLTLDHYDVGLYYSMPFIRNATAKVVNIEAGLNARIADARADISQSSIGQSANIGTTATVPMVYLGAQITPIKSFPSK